MPRQPSTCRRPRSGVGIRGGGCATKCVPPELTNMHTPRCTSVHPPIRPLRSQYQRFLDIAQQNLTWVGIECRPLRAQEDSVSTDRQHQRFASPFHPSRQLDQKRSQNLPVTEVPEKISLFPQKRQAKPSALHPIPPLVAARLSNPSPATATQSRVCICHTQCMRFCPLDILSLMVRPWRKRTSAAAGLLIMTLLQHNRRQVVKSRSTRGCGAWVRC